MARYLANEAAVQAITAALEAALKPVVAALERIASRCDQR